MTLPWHRETLDLMQGGCLRATWLSNRGPEPGLMSAAVQPQLPQ